MLVHTLLVQVVGIDSIFLISPAGDPRLSDSNTSPHHLPRTTLKPLTLVVKLKKTRTLPDSTVPRARSSSATIILQMVDIHSLPPEILGLITEWIGAMEAVENRRLLRSERKLCICEDEEEERYHRYKRSRHDLPFHSGVLKVSSLSHRFRNIIFESRKLRGISMPFYRSSLDRCADIREGLKQDIR